MRVKNWRAQEVFTAIVDQAMENANTVMDEVVVAAKSKCPVSPIYRPGRFGRARVSFTPKTGKNKGNLVQFTTMNRWMGRSPGNLRDTIRRVNKPDSGTIRVYAGNFKIYWAFMIEKGYTDRGGRYHPGIPYLRGSFWEKKAEVLKRIKGGGKSRGRR